MLILELATVVLLYYQVTMPEVGNAKYTVTTLGDCIYIYNSQDGKLKEKVCE